jgi:hypothetical protein
VRNENILTFPAHLENVSELSFVSFQSYIHDIHIFLFYFFIRGKTLCCVKHCMALDVRWHDFEVDDDCGEHIALCNVNLFGNLA